MTWTPDERHAYIQGYKDARDQVSSVRLIVSSEIDDAIALGVSAAQRVLDRQIKTFESEEGDQ